MGWISTVDRDPLEVGLGVNPEQANSALPLKQNYDYISSTYTSPQLHVFLNTHLTKGGLSFSGVFKLIADHLLIPTTTQLVYKSIPSFFNKFVLKYTAIPCLKE